MVRCDLKKCTRCSIVVLRSTEFSLLPTKERGQVSRFEAGGSRVIRLIGTRMHMADLNPSAVMCGVGKVVRELTTILTRKSTYSFTEGVTAYLLYVEIVNNEPDSDSSMWYITTDEEKMLVFA